MLPFGKVTKFIQAVLMTLVLLVTLMTGSISSAQAQSGEAGLFGEAGVAESGANPAQVARSRLVTLQLGALYGPNGSVLDAPDLPALTFNLFPDAVFTGLVGQVQKGPSQTVWIGRLQGIDSSYFYMVRNSGAFIAHIGSPRGIYEVSLAGDDFYRVIQLNQSKMEDDAPYQVMPPGALFKPGDLTAAADSGAIIDIMVAYTAAARAAEGSTAAMNARIALAVTETNQAYANSGVTPRLRLVHAVEVAYAETGNIGTDLTRLMSPSDGFIDNVHTLRNTYAADMVSLIVNNGGAYCGVAAAIMATASSAFQVTARANCMTGYYSFGHEFGHLQGLRHDIYVDPTNTPYAYGHGHVNTGARWRTVMAYNNKCSDLGFSCTRLQYFSNPTRTYGGAPMGVVGVSENYKVLNLTAYTVANFRQSVVTTPGFTSNFSGSASGWVPVYGTWGILSSSYLFTPGTLYFSSARYNGSFNTLTYTARMMRTGPNLGLANHLVVRGNPAVLNGVKAWPSYLFGYSNNGYFSVWRENVGGTETALKGWTASAAIVQNGWNVLKVVASGSTLKFYINNVLVYSGTDATYSSGQVGVAMYRSVSGITTDLLQVDYATLTTTADVAADEVVAQGVEVSGGDSTHAP